MDIQNALIFLRLIDAHDGKLSLSSVALIIILIKLAIIPNVGLVELGALLFTLINYSAKKIINKNAEISDEGTLQPAIDDLQLKVTDLESKMSLQNFAAGFKKL